MILNSQYKTTTTFLNEIQVCEQYINYITGQVDTCKNQNGEITHLMN